MKMSLYLLVLVLIVVACFSTCTRAVPRHVVVVIYQRGFDDKIPMYRLYLLGVSLSEIRFEQASLAYKKEDANRYGVFGNGLIRWRSNSIQIDDAAVRVNGKELRKRSLPAL